jgi:hypothetical protein
MDVTTDWFWEGNVVEAIARHLANEGWTIIRAFPEKAESGIPMPARI